jgi:hypothetical protein
MSQPAITNKPKKRTSKKTEETNITIEVIDENSMNKKRGRKPKGGKLIARNTNDVAEPAPIPNIILHLKCSSKDLEDYNTRMSQMMTNPLDYVPTIPPEIHTYLDPNDAPNYSLYNAPTTEPYAYSDKGQITKTEVCCKCKDLYIANENTENDVSKEDENINMKDLNKKLKSLKIQLYKNGVADKKSACFWCSYDFDNPACYIPKYETDQTIFGYGSFCRPECAVAYLMRENIDDSTKFERYHLLNQIYSKVYDYKKNIKPAPNPHYLLDKYYGNMTIQEYRKLLKTEHMLLVIDKPLTRILPELHEDNDDFILNIFGNNNTTTANQGSVYKVKRQSEKTAGPSKSSIIRDKFGMSN